MWRGGGGVTSGAQKDPGSEHGEMHGALGVTQILVIGQHTFPAVQPDASLRQLTRGYWGVRQAFASGQQYACEQAGGHEGRHPRNAALRTEV